MDVTLPASASITSSADDHRLVFPQGSTHPPFRARILDADGEPVVVSDMAMLELAVWDDDTHRTFPLQATDDPGVVEYQWRANDVESSGRYRMRVVLSTMDGQKLKVPSESALRLHITPSE